MFSSTIRSSLRIARPIARANNLRFLSSTRVIRQDEKLVKTAYNLAEVHGPDSLIGPGAKEGSVPSDLEQATGLERLELLGKLEGIEVFDLKPLDSSRIGTLANPIVVDTYDDYRYVGCTGSPAGSHETMWLKPTVEKVARCWECGSVYKVNPLGVPTDDHHH